jgi:hypothetical protein
MSRLLIGTYNFACHLKRSGTFVPHVLAILLLDTFY